MYLNSWWKAKNGGDIICVLHQIMSHCVQNNKLEAECKKKKKNTDY